MLLSYNNLLPFSLYFFRNPFQTEVIIATHHIRRSLMENEPYKMAIDVGEISFVTARTTYSYNLKRRLRKWLLKVLAILTLDTIS